MQLEVRPWQCWEPSPALENLLPPHEPTKALVQPFVAYATKGCTDRFMVPMRGRNGLEAPHEPPGTSNIQRTSKLSISSAFDVGCWMLDVRCCPLVQGFNGRKVSENSLPRPHRRPERSLKRHPFSWNPRSPSPPGRGRRFSSAGEGSPFSISEHCH